MPKPCSSSTTKLWSHEDDLGLLAAPTRALAGRAGAESVCRVEAGRLLRGWAFPRKAEGGLLSEVNPAVWKSVREMNGLQGGSPGVVLELRQSPEPSV